MVENKENSPILRELDALETFLREASDAKLEKAAAHIFERVKLQMAGLKTPKEKSLAPRFFAVLSAIEPYLKPQQDREMRLAEKISLENKINESKIIHFHFNDKFANPTIRFINKYFVQKDHLHLVFRLFPESYSAQEFSTGENVVELDYRILNPIVLKDKKLIFHSFFVHHNVMMLYKNPYLLKHSYWMAWGGDLYNAPTDAANEFVRKNIYGIGSFCDNKLIEQKYGNNHKFFTENLAITPIGKEEIHAAVARVVKKEPAVVIQVNNSADSSTLDMLDVLSKFKEENIKIKTVLSYGDTRLSGEIIEKGKSIFADKFTYLSETIPPERYMEYLAENDILILYQNRQQGGANCCASLLAGKKVFIRSGITTSKWFEDLGFTIFDSNKISEMGFAEFTRLDRATIEKNKKLLEDNVYNDELRANSGFKQIFDDDCFADTSVER